ncbi:MAG TPA: hypothetical protein VGO98_00485 [Candidatus Saccharimonadales bacterium]|nr:hypothetical protein [Candidatus Saccharimonadales bacterium]
MVKKSTTSKTKATPNTRVDYYPNRMGLVVAAIATISLVILGIIATYN